MTRISPPTPGSSRQQQQQQHPDAAATHAIAPRKSNNVRALAYKAISYQKRQVFANVCCISCCPLIFVLIAAALGSVVQTLLNNSTTIEDIQYCSNFPSLHLDGFPRYNTSDPLIHGANVTNGKAVNFMRHVYIDNYPHNSDIYERNSNASLSQKIDSTYYPPPDGGWISVLSSNSDSEALNRFTQNQLNFWGVSSASSDALSSILGVPTSSAVAVASLQSFLTATNLTVFVDPSFSTGAATATSTNTAGSGLLGAIGSRLYANISSTTGLQGFIPVPYFVAPNASASSNPSTSDLALDDDLTARIQDLLVQLAQLNKTVLQETDPSTSALTDFYVRAGAVTAKMPHGSVFLDAISTDGASLGSRLVLHVGTDKRVDAAANFPPKGQRLLAFLTQLDQATLKYFATTVGGKLVGAKITQGLRAFPDTQSTRLNYEFAGIIGRILFPFGVSFLLPIFVITLVKEKEDRILAMMKMNGLKAWAYYVSHYVTFFILYAISSIIFIVAGRLTKLSLFTKTGLPVILLLFFVWGNAQVTLAFFFASFFNRSRMALVLVFLIVLCGVIISLVTNQIFDDGDFPSAFFIWPPFAFYRALYVLNVATYDSTKRPYDTNDLSRNNEVTLSMLYMVVEVIVYGLIGIYLTAVLPSQYGQRRPWHFPITDTLALFNRSSSSPGDDSLAFGLSSSRAGAGAPDETAGLEDADVIAERRRVDAAAYPPNAPIVISHLRKVYASRAPGSPPKVAVKDVSFAAESGLVLGLLGPNGAGKTTLISMLTGLYDATAGAARLSGYDIQTQISEVYKVIGICPQFDILWEDLSVEEHLYFYCRLKGTKRRDERATVETALEQVSLTTLRRRQTKTLSGGEKRRLSIAIALVGQPAVVFLDEPTTGLDPEVRRLIWNIIHRAKENKTIILTTHSMEEAEAVCQRIGIMSKGVLRCYANPLRLKELYGTGFRLFFNSPPEHTARACEWVESILPPGFTKLDAFATNTSYEFASGPGVMSRLFEIMERGKEQAGILDWGISQTTLEEVFLRIISENDADAD
ncbi:hypothetical protein DFJ73DRAFT_904539 [Zopfochytrium polystomum]|nr:hypothetical protein DFJ73DRAFT_904539 [Zopfochytrium polystomum]